MASKHLKQLLNEDQEPFILQNYINEKRLQLKKPVPKPNTNSTFPTNLCKNACFLSTPDVQKSPLFSPAKSPCRNTFFVHIPSRTAALLLEAALRIQKQSDNTQKNTKSSKNLSFSFFGSFLKRLTRRKKKKLKEIEREVEEIRVCVKDIIRWESIDATKKKAEEEVETCVGLDEKRVSDVGFSFSSWTESNIDKSLDLDISTSRDLDTSTSSRSEFSQEIQRCHSFEKRFSSRSPLPKFECLASTPVIRSPELNSPNHHKKQVVEKDEQLNHVANFEEDKEHNSPVSVLDPQFEEDDNEGQEDEEDGEDEEDNDLERTFTFVHRAKQQLLDKLRRFELLAELDPVELERRIAEEDEDAEEEEGSSADGNSISEDGEKGNVLVREVVSAGSNYIRFRKIPVDMKRLVRELMPKGGDDTEPYRVHNRPNSWKEVESNTIDMIVDSDFRTESKEWLKFTEHVEDIGVAIESSIFSFLVEELFDPSDP